MSDAFVVAIKPSARRTNGAVGKLVNRDGTRHDFGDRRAAESWAAALTSRGGELVWIRAANPNDPADVAAYLVGRTRSVGGYHRSPDGERQASIGRAWSDDPAVRFGIRAAPGRVAEGDHGDDGDQASIDRFTGNGPG